jgi:hypothetical protein
MDIGRHFFHYQGSTLLVPFERLNSLFRVAIELKGKVIGVRYIGVFLINSVHATASYIKLLLISILNKSTNLKSILYQYYLR